MKKILTLLFIMALCLPINAQKSISITNPSFENGTTGWTTNMSTQSNNIFSRKQGTYYF